jgi:hypothetical protein
LKLHAAAAEKDDSGAVAAARKLFGFWADALKAAGIDPRQHRVSRHPWTKPEVVAELHHREKAGEPLNSGWVGRRHGWLVAAATKLFGSWDQALKAASIDPDAVRLTQHGQVTTESVLREMRRMSVADLKRATAAPHPQVYHRARQVFGAWERALRVLGMDPQQVGMRQKWTDEKVLAAISKLKDRASGFNQKNNRALYLAAFRRFGSWSRALAAVGFDPAESSRRISWTKAMVVEALKARQAHGEAVSASAVHREDARLSSAVYKLFGSWPKALKAAGVV